MQIFIPSYKRAGRVRGVDYFPAASIVVPESQRDDYTKYYGAARLIVIPDEADGNVAKKKNWILRNMARPLLIVDDDVQCLTTTEGEYDADGVFLGRSKQMIRLTIEQADGVITQGFNLAHDWNCPIWGMNCNTDGRNYQQYRPFSLTQVILGPFTGFLCDDLFYDERLFFKEDYDLSLQALNKYRRALRMNKYAYYCDHGTEAGGVVSQRSMGREMEQCRKIEKKWGRSIISYPRDPARISQLLNGNVNVPINGV